MIQARGNNTEMFRTQNEQGSENPGQDGGGMFLAVARDKMEGLR